VIALDWNRQKVHIEVQWVGRQELQSDNRHPLIIFLHEGLGSVSAWGDFPERLCRQLNIAGLAYSRPGYGQSTPRAADEHWQPDYLHRQAKEVLPLVLEALGVDLKSRSVFLLGHSDGASIALIHAAMSPTQLSGIVLMAPHIFVEDVTIDGVERAREAYLTTRLRERLSRHHRDPDSAFWGWNRIWLDPRFRSWSIAHEIGAITCPVFAMQGLQDEYATMAQLHGIAQRLPQTRLLEIAECGHAPHRDQPDMVCAAIQDFILSIDQ